MKTPFPGMDPYLEHPIVWEGVHARLIVAIANQLQPNLDPRYVASIEERVFIEGPQQRIPDVWIQKPLDEGPYDLDVSESNSDHDTAVVVEIEELEIHQKRVEILDAYNNMKLVTLIEVLSPTTKRRGPGRESYKEKQREVLERDCHLVEIDLLRDRERVLSIPAWRLEQLAPFHYATCVNRWPRRNRFEVYPRELAERLPRIAVPLIEPDPDVTLDLQSTLKTVFLEGRYLRRLRYNQPCEPALNDEFQKWADECWAAYRTP